jgi:Uma2 family endonuclease
VGERDHSRLQALFTGWFLNRETRSGTKVMVEQRVQVTSRRFRVPDIAVLKGGAAGRPDRHPASLPVCRDSFPSDRFTEMQERISDYLNFGAQYVWLADLVTRRSFIYTKDSIHEARDGVLSTGNPDIRLAPSELE